MVKNFTHVTVDNFLEIVGEVLRANPTYAGQTTWHPEDLHYAVICVSEDVANTLLALNKRGLLIKEMKEEQPNEVSDSSK